MSFHEVRFPSEISRGATGGPERRTDVVILGSGFEERNARWADSRRKYNAGYGVRNVSDLHNVIGFFEERRGRLHGFRWKDHADYRSRSPADAVAQADQTIATGDGVTTTFQLIKTYGAGFQPYSRRITKPVQGTLLLAVNSVSQLEGTDFTVDYTTGSIVFQSGSIPASAAVITAGFEFDVPVRFDSDQLEINLASFEHGSIPNIPIVEVRS